jgi:NADH dehydrogenase FAD-containing subunit
MNERSQVRPTVAVIGGGYAGINAAKSLDEVADVVLVEPKETFVHNVAALRALTDPSWLSRVYLPYDRLLGSGRVVRDRAVKVGAGWVGLASGQQIQADYIVLATGSAYPFPAKSDVDSAAAAQAKVHAAHAALSAAKRVLLVGAGPVGIELSGEIKAVWPDKHVTLLDAGDDVLGIRFRPELKAELRRQLAGLGVELLLASRLREDPPTAVGQRETFTVGTESVGTESVGTESVGTESVGTESVGSVTVGSVTADIWFRCHGVTPVSDYLADDLAVARQPDGFIAVTPYLQVVDQDHVFAIGDVSTADHNMIAIARRQAQLVAGNIQALIDGNGALKAYEPEPPSIMVPMGPKSGAGQLPGSGDLAGPELVAETKGRDMYVGRYLDLLGLPASYLSQ